MNGTAVSCVYEAVAQNGSKWHTFSRIFKRATSHPLPSERQINQSKKSLNFTITTEMSQNATFLQETLGIVRFSHLPIWTSLAASRRGPKECQVCHWDPQRRAYVLSQLEYSKPDRQRFIPSPVLA